MNRKDLFTGFLFSGCMMLLGYSSGGSDPSVTGSVTTRLLKPKVSPGAPLNGATADRIGTVWKGGTPTEQMALASAWETITDPEEIKRLLENLDLLPANISKECARSALLKNWVKVEAEEAIRWCQTYSDDLLPRLMESWAAADIDAVRSKAMTTGVNSHAALMARSVLKVLADTDPREALGFLVEIGYRLENYEGYLTPAIGKLARMDPALLLDAAENAGDGIREKCRAAAASELAKNDPDYAIKWSSNQPDKAELMDAVCESLDSAYWRDGLAAVADDSGTPGFVFDWVRKDPKNVLELVLEMGMEDARFKNATAYAVRTIYTQGDSDTIHWIESLNHDKINVYAAEVRSSLDRKNDAAEPQPPTMTAEAFVSSSVKNSSSFFQLPADERAKIADVVSTLPGKDAVEFVDELFYAGSQIPFKTSTELLTVLVPNADSEETSNQIVSLVKGVVSKWGAMAPEETAKWVESLPPGAVRAEAVKATAQTWAIYDEERAGQWEAANTSAEAAN